MRRLEQRGAVALAVVLALLISHLVPQLVELIR